MNIIIAIIFIFVGFSLYMIGIAGVKHETKNKKLLLLAFAESVSSLGFWGHTVFALKRWKKDKPYPQIALLGFAISLISLIYILSVD